MVSSTGGAAQQLAEVMAVLASSDSEETAAQRGIERIAECFDAEVGALVRDGVVTAVIGFPAGKVPEVDLLEASAGRRDAVELPGVGPGAAVTVPVDTEPASSLLLVRTGGEGFDPEEVSLLRGMAKVLALALRMLGMVAVLQQSEQYTRAILHYADDAFISMNDRGLITAWNEKAVKTFGWSEGEAIGRILSDLVIPPEYRQAHHDGLARFLATGEGAVLNQRIEIKARRADNIDIPVELAIWPVLINGVWSFNAFVRDISQRRRAEEALRANERRLGNAQEIARVGSWEWDAGDDRMTWSDQLCRTFGRVAGYTSSLDGLSSSLHPSDRPVVEQEVRTASESHQSFELECRATAFDEAECIVQVRGEPVFDAHGAFVGMRGTVQDVTEMKATEREKDRIANELRLLLESAAEGIWGVDVDGNFTFVNRAAGEMLGWEPEELIGRNSHALIHHSRPDGSPYPTEECTTFLSFRTGGGHRVDGEVLWRRDGTPFPAAYACYPLVREGAVEGSVVTCSDITDRQLAEAALRDANRRLEELASTDVLTGLPNRTLFSDRLDQALALGRREGREVAVLFIDLDRFKIINDSLGHHAGDELLTEVSRRLCAVVRDSDTIARLGGDEFAVLLGGTTSPGEAVAAAERILESLREPFQVGGVECFSGASVGVALWPEDCNSKAELLQHADVAMYRAKAAGGDRFEMFQPAMTVAARDRLMMEGEMRRAIEEGEFFLRYHPQVELATGAAVGVEALLRWAHPHHGEMMPIDFISVAEDSGLIVMIGEWVIVEACRQAAMWRVEVPGCDRLRVAVNVSSRQLADPGFVAQVSKALVQSGIEPSQLELEIGETSVMNDLSPAVVALKSLRELGVRLAIDDFGTALASICQLQRFPVDRLKFDKSFLAGLCGGEMVAQRQRAMVAAVVDLAHALGMSAVAEGVETEEQRRALVEIGAELGQGYLWSRPLQSDEVAGWLATNAG